ncbi:hypothetical protein SARC_14475 [Sphaeroforma arctica JP610]|uniref:Uncharacterized protein n=1 Tax=Sphaeroforma arctica JP610 TaxID=667725 RepID=A0A0L0F8B8_9EUKA|nr:hypothetical protein SARC_14475 [Sphaeroforma arctica JP610]KNC72962.1 hypothetical protein SARC_14475 [Sphaeroforma arctica JP610]|eukprot:XP_014146864.1 hypothetical protein SARC_14475 [Sphaeroforma arctica JP610]
MHVIHPLTLGRMFFQIIRQAILGCYFAMRFLPAILFFVLVLSLPVQFVVSSIWFWIFVIMTLSLLRNKFAFRMGTWLHPNVDPVNLRLSFIDRDFNENDYELLLALDESTTSKRKGTAMAIVQGLPSRILAADLEVCYPQ